jgi:hypothetical protein
VIKKSIKLNMLAISSLLLASCGKPTQDKGVDHRPTVADVMAVAEQSASVETCFISNLKFPRLKVSFPYANYSR